MGFFGFFRMLKLIFPLLSKSKGVLASITILALGVPLVLAEVTKKHDLAMVEIKENREKVIEVAIAQGKVLGVLHAIQSSLEDVKRTVDKTDSRVWKLVTDKRRRNGNHN